MKKILLTALILSFASSAFAGVVGSKHDIPATYPTAAGVAAEAASNGLNQTRICGYCHTPHHANLDAADQGLPLWSRATVDAGTYANYDSFTLDGGLSDAGIGSSWLCLSCHDGSTAVDAHYNFAGNALLTGDGYGDPAIGAAGDLTNDHPIGVNMVDAFAAEQTNILNPLSSGLFDPTTQEFLNNTKVAGMTIDKFLYNGEFVTCASCHDVHNKDVVDGPYMLYAAYGDSDICLSCHNK
ncbi:MAG: hypothetical protein CVU69_09085 [Deltaproteobacteria bacterium HGW-Deltaproteobacteria-4]|nr:MAG: hypothetical protein CVU69_09085 [Deltaproteobacteria bacterium HGW-Deltaproteobacteria-4]